MVGANASGKSNFLDAFRFLRDLSTIGGGFQEAVQSRGGVTALRCLAARRNPDIAIGIDIGTDDEPQLWQYLLRFKQTSQRIPRVAQETVKHRGKTLLTRPLREDEEDPELLTQTHIEQVNVNREFRNIAEFLTTIRYFHIVPQLVREPDRSVGRTNDPFGGDFLDQIAQTSMNTRNARLRKITKALQVAVPQLQELELSRDQRGTPHLRGKYEHWRPHGAWQTEEQLSDGTLRLLGLLWSLLEGRGPLLLEEPELSLHPDVVRHLPQMVYRMQRKTGRQVLTSSHSPELFQDTGIGLDEVLVLIPTTEGTQVRAASAIREVRALLEGGLENLGEAVLPFTRPADAGQLNLFEAF